MQDRGRSEVVPPVPSTTMTATTKRTKPAATPPADPAATGDVAPAGTITFRGRTMRVKKPGVEQLGMWRVTADQLNRADPNMDGNAASKLIGRAIKMVCSVLAGEEDRDWLQDEILDGNLTLDQSADIMLLAVAAYKAEAGSTAPANGPRPKARRAR